MTNLGMIVLIGLAVEVKACRIVNNRFANLVKGKGLRFVDTKISGNEK